MSECIPCKAIDCSNGLRLDDDYNLYRLQSELYPLVIPFGLNVPGAEIRLPCCGIDIVRTVPQGLSPGGFAFLVGQMLDECALQTPFCEPTGLDAPATTPMFQLSVECCDGELVVRQIPTFTPMSQVQTILAQMAGECALHAGCEGQLFSLVITAFDALIAFLDTVIQTVIDLFDAFYSGDVGALEDAATQGHATADELRNLVEALRNALINLVNDETPTPEQQALINLINILLDGIDLTADIIDLLADLAHNIAIGGDPQLIIDQLVALIPALRLMADDLDDAATVLEALDTGTLATLVVAETRVLADAFRVIADLIDAYDVAHELTLAFCSGVPAELDAAAAHALTSAAQLTTDANSLLTRANTLQTALNAASGLLPATNQAQVQADINLITAFVPALLCLSNALVAIAAVATAQSTGVGMVAALAALEAVAVCLETSATGLIANGEAPSISMATRMQDIAAALRRLAIGSETQCDFAIEFERAVLLFLVFQLQILTRLERDLLIVTELLLTDLYNPPLTISTRCECDNFLVTRTLSGALTQAQLQVIYQSIIAECAARCPQPPPINTTGPGGAPIQIFASAPMTCTVSCPDGTPFSWTTPAGLYIGLSQASVNQAAYVGACAMAAFFRICLSTLPTYTCFGVPRSLNVVSQSGSPSSGSIWTLTSGALPTGMTLVPHGNFATIEGTPSAVGEFTFTIRVVASNGAFASKPYTMRVLRVLPDPLPIFQVGSSYSVQLTLSGSAGTVTFAVVAGALPAGITLTAAGLLSGIPTSVAPFSFTIGAFEA